MIACIRQKNDQGQTTAEYALIIAIITATIVAAVAALGGAVIPPIIRAAGVVIR